MLFRNIRGTSVAFLLMRLPKPIAHGFRRCLDLAARITDWETALHKAVCFGDPDVIKGLIKAGANPNARYRGRSPTLSSGETPLHGAASRSMNYAPSVVRFLIEAGADVDAKTEYYGATPLHHAVREPGLSVVEIVDVLIGAGANVDARDREAQTPLHMASSTYSPNAVVVQALIDAGADPTAQDRNGRTPLHVAAGSRYVKNQESLTVLIDAGADPNARAGNGWTPLHFATLYNKRPAIIEALLNAGADPVARTAEGDIPWNFANDEVRLPYGNPGLSDADMKASAAYRRLAEAEENWGNWNTADFFKSATPENVAQAVGAYVDPNVQDVDGTTPLHWAARFSGRPAVIDELLKAGASATTRNSDGNIPLHWAAEHNENAAIIDALIKHVKSGHVGLARGELGTDAPDNWIDMLGHSYRKFSGYIDARNDSGDTPLRLANNLTVLKVLVRAGADPDAENDLDETPLHQHIFDPAFTRVLLEAGADPKNRDIAGCTPLHRARDSTVIELLIRAGADPDIRDHHGKAPLHHVAQTRGDVAVVRTLVKAGADPNARSEDGETPLHSAARFAGNPAAHRTKPSKHYSEELSKVLNSKLLLESMTTNSTIIAALLDAGADLEAKDNEGLTPLHVAAKHNGNPEIVDRLLDAGAKTGATNADGLTPWDCATDNETIKDSHAYERLRQGA